MEENVKCRIQNAKVEEQMEKCNLGSLNIGSCHHVLSSRLHVTGMNYKVPKCLQMMHE